MERINKKEGRYSLLSSHLDNSFFSVKDISCQFKKNDYNYYHYRYSSNKCGS